MGYENKYAARVGDSWIGSAIIAVVNSQVPVIIPSVKLFGAPNGSPTVFINGRPAVRMTDEVASIPPNTMTCAIIDGSSTVMINGLPAVRAFDAYSSLIPPGGIGTPPPTGIQIIDGDVGQDDFMAERWQPIKNSLDVFIGGKSIR